MFPHPSVAVHVRTRAYTLGQSGSAGITTSIGALSVGTSVQVSMKLGTEASAAAIPSASPHCTVASRNPSAIAATGGVESAGKLMCCTQVATKWQLSSAVHMRSIPQGVVVSLGGRTAVAQPPVTVG